MTAAATAASELTMFGVARRLCPLLLPVAQRVACLYA